MALTVAQTADAGAPQAGITVDGLSTGTGCAVTVTVSWDGGLSWHAVRGGTLTGVLGSTFIRDYVTPLNVAATYRAVVTGGTTATWTATSTIASPFMWLQDPLDPRSAVPVAAATPNSGVLCLISPSFGPLPRFQLTSLETPEGATMPVASLGRRQKPANIPLNIRGLAQEQATLLKALRDLLDTSGQVAMRGIPSAIALDAVIHVTVQETEGSLPNLNDAYNVFELSVTQVRPVGIRIVVPWWTYDQVKALVQSQISPSATYTQVLTAQPSGKTYTQWLANPGVAS